MCYSVLRVLSFYIMYVVHDALVDIARHWCSRPAGVTAALLHMSGGINTVMSSSEVQTMALRSMY